MDTNNRVFTLSRLKNQMPKTVKEIQNFPFSREPVVNETVRNLKIAINNIDIANKDWNEFNVRVGNDLIDINKAEFKDIYLMFLGKKTEIREWETRMNNYLQTPGTNWEKVWQNLHNKINITYVKSALWEMYHLNFWSGYRAGEFTHRHHPYPQ